MVKSRRKLNKYERLSAIVLNRNEIGWKIDWLEITMYFPDKVFEVECW